MKSDWLKYLKEKLEKAGIDVTVETESGIEDFIEGIDESTVNLEDIRFVLRDDDANVLYSTFDQHKELMENSKELIAIKNSECSTEYMEIDTDITPMLDLIESQQLSKHIKWMRELT
jgi:hypothetical protein